MESIRITLENNSETKEIQPSESEFFGYVLAGCIEIKIGSKLFKATEGNSFYYKGTKKHKIKTKGGSTFIWISSPPIF